MAFFSTFNASGRFKEVARGAVAHLPAIPGNTKE